MVTTTLPLTLYLAQAIGLYLVLVGLSALVAPGRWRQVMDEFAASAALTLVTGVFVFILGIALVRIHWVLTDPLAIIVTVVGWIALFEGALLIVVPHLLLRIGKGVLPYTTVWALLCLLLGILLGIAGLTGTAGHINIV